ncbi:hypothetical protein H920_04080 [Fukomys damarensis]|uniref:Uncharacterized protein n=1 Tax=Fukomys damarensis TaxID=885580 RepID=A0A091EGD4_FUKDA|nr:hypothetical protein H920_04080 [Fukomys damarensis]
MRPQSEFDVREVTRAPYIRMLTKCSKILKQRGMEEHAWIRRIPEADHELKPSLGNLATSPNAVSEYGIKRE